MPAQIEFLELDDLIDLARRLLGDPPPIGDVGLLAAAVARPQAVVGEVAAYPTTWLKAAALLQSIVHHHALTDGNKRLGWLAAAVFLELNGASVARASNDDVYVLVTRVAESTMGIDHIADHLESLARAR